MQLKTGVQIIAGVLAIISAVILVKSIQNILKYFQNQPEILTLDIFWILIMNTNL